MSGLCGPAANGGLSDRQLTLKVATQSSAESNPRCKSLPLKNNLKGLFFFTSIFLPSLSLSRPLSHSYSQTGQLHGSGVSPEQQKVENFCRHKLLPPLRYTGFHYPALKCSFFKGDDKSSSPPDTIPFIWRYPNCLHGVGVKAADSPEHMCLVTGWKSNHVTALFISALRPSIDI